MYQIKVIIKIYFITNIMVLIMYYECLHFLYFILIMYFFLNG
jgi:hypothetical protein